MNSNPHATATAITNNIHEFLERIGLLEAWHGCCRGGKCRVLHYFVKVTVGVIVAVIVSPLRE